MRLRKPSHPGELLERAKAGKSIYKHKKRHKMSPLTGLKEGSPKDMAMDEKIAKKMPFHKSMKHKAMHKKPKLGSGKRFAALKSKLAKKGATNPGALAAYIGRKALGKKKFQQLAAKGKKRHHKAMHKGKKHHKGDGC